MNRYKSLPLLALVTMLLSACQLSFSFSNPFNSSNSETTTSAASSYSYSAPSVEPGVGYYRASDYSITQNDYNMAAGLFTLPATGTQKLLVIPVSFTDYPCGPTCSTRLDSLEKAFFGTASETSWESVTSYYYKSSYGQLTLEGIVTPVYESSMSTATFASSTRTTGDYASYFDPTWLIVEQAVSWYKSYSGSTLSDYDQDNDGFIDAVWLVYNNPNSRYANYTAEGEDVFWAYTYWDYDNWNYGNVSSPVPMTYAWASYDFMYEGYGSQDIDAHTYIHETGHVLGLDDYYSYTDGDWGAAGGVDMMDFNIVDHNAYSKFLLGWADPYVINGEVNQVTIQLNPFEASGEFILINDGWNGSAYDEYLAIEFYTPTGINYLDSQPGGYPGNGLRGFSVPGIKIYHVDSRLGLYNNSGFTGYTDTATLSSYTYPYIAHSNTVEYSQNENFRLLHLLEAGGVNTFKNSNEVATNATLFKQGDTFTPASFGSFFYYTTGRFNDNTAIGYSISVGSVTNTKATLTITKI
ncbi:MAG TPA: hypothetical protein PK340_03790 [Bacilli bacterium]|mgnify:CR=1 FL=1|nr:hypothetical protein [Bacilli bacterium]